MVVRFSYAKTKTPKTLMVLEELLPNKETAI